MDSWQPIPEGTKVRLNVDRIKSDPEWDENPTDYNKRRYVDFINANEDKIFTVEYDPKYCKQPNIVCLKEDTTEPYKWLFWEKDLIVVKEP